MFWGICDPACDLHFAVGPRSSGSLWVHLAASEFYLCGILVVSGEFSGGKAYFNRSDSGGSFSGEQAAWQEAKRRKSPGLCGSQRLQRGKPGKHVYLWSLLDNPQGVGAFAWLVFENLPVHWSLTVKSTRRGTNSDSRMGNQALMMLEAKDQVSRHGQPRKPWTGRRCPVFISWL